MKYDIEKKEIRKARDGLSLIGTYYHTLQNNKDKVIIMNNAFATNTKSYQIYSEFPQEAIKQGYDVFQYDFTGLGESPGDHSQTTVSTQINDLETVIDNFGDKKIILLGHSMGGIVATNNYHNADAIVLWNSPISLKRLHNNYKEDVERDGFIIRYREGKPIKVGAEMWKEFNTITHNPEAFEKLPVLFIVGSEDKNIMNDKEEYIKKYFNSNTTQYITNGANHEFENNSNARAEAIKITLDWLNKQK